MVCWTRIGGSGSGVCRGYRRFRKRASVLPAQANTPVGVPTLESEKFCASTAERLKGGDEHKAACLDTESKAQEKLAAAAFGDHMHPDVVALRRFRDRHLVRSRAGRIFVRFYWKIGPGLARVTSPQSPHGRLSRSALSWLVRILSRHGLT